MRYFDRPEPEQLPTGLPLSDLDLPLTLVPGEHKEQPARAFDLRARLADRDAEIREHFEWRSDCRKDWYEGDPYRALHALPDGALGGLTFDELAKVAYTGVLQNEGHRSFDMHHALSHRHEVVAKVKSSLWRWGYDRDWNAVVLALRSIAAFDFGLPGFRTTFDYTTGYNEIGYSKHTRTYLDGALGLVVWQGTTHVATIGFSIARGRRVLLTQVQLKNKKGNRWLYKIPGGDLLEYVIGRFEACFPDFRLHLVHGRDLADRLAGNYAEDKRPAPEVFARVASTYSRRLSTHVRRRPTRIGGLRFHPLARRTVAGGVADRFRRMAA